MENERKPNANRYSAFQKFWIYVAKKIPLKVTFAVLRISGVYGYILGHNLGTNGTENV